MQLSYAFQPTKSSLQAGARSDDKPRYF